MKNVSFQEKLENELKVLLEKADFIAVTLSDESGLVLATKGNSALTTTMSALSSLSLEFKESVQNETLLYYIDEVSTVSENKFRFVNRYFEINNNYYILSIIVPPNTSYRSVSNQSIANITKLFMEHQNNSTI